MHLGSTCHRDLTEDMGRETKDTLAADGHTSQVLANGQAETSSLVDEAALFASPLPLTGDRKTTTRVELWVCQLIISASWLTPSLGTCTTSVTRV
jgi:hypothetical protein